MRNITLSVIVALSSVSALPVLGQSNASLTQVSASTQQYSNAELDSVLAPIALYPDTLLTHILIAATYPLDVISADRWRQSNKHLTPEQVENVLANVSWDPSVKALASFSDLLNTMANDLEWLQQLGDNVLIDQSRVLDRVQVLRQHALNTGNLVTNDYIEVERERETTREIIYIEPRQREVVYVPYYDPHIVYGHWWHTTSPVRWRHHVSYHHHSNVYWSPSIHLSTFFFFSSVHWHNRHVVIHREPVRRYYHGSPRKRVISRDYRRWEHNSVHRRARYSTRVIHSAPSRYEHADVLRTKHLSNKQIRLVNTQTHHNEKRTARPISRSENTKSIKRTVTSQQITPLRESRFQIKQDSVNRKQSIERALKRNQAMTRSEKPTRNQTLDQLKRDKAARISTSSESKRYANRENALQRQGKQRLNRERLERTSPQNKQVVRESSEPRRTERMSTPSVRRAQVKVPEASRNRVIKRDRSEKVKRQVSRVERHISKGNSYRP
ncbi:DUF3300 domain-containing protein [Alteromonas sp. S015]|uniref:DUF3300 domain-containing protein n=1 Tax=Alteromonas sp. S015 TaxID=3117401 RepID=UPI002FE23833